jgi:hypothetical protein
LRKEAKDKFKNSLLPLSRKFFNIIQIKTMLFLTSEQRWAITIARTLYLLSVTKGQIEINAFKTPEKVQMESKQFTHILTDFFFDLLVRNMPWKEHIRILYMTNL